MEKEIKDQVFALAITAWVVIIFSIAAYYTAILTILITRPYIAAIRCKVNEPACYELYRQNKLK